MDEHPYQVFNPEGRLVLSAPEYLRYRRKTELSLLEVGYTIRLHGRRITKTEVRKEIR